MKLPGFPNPETYRSLKIAVHEAVRAASDKPDDAFKWVQEVYERSATLESFRETGKFLTLDTKIPSAWSRVAKVSSSDKSLITMSRKLRQEGCSR